MDMSKYDFKKGDKIIAVQNANEEIKKDETYTVEKIDGDFVYCKELKYGHFCFYFKKKIKIKQIKKLTDMSLINSRPEVNAKKINEIIDTINELTEIIKKIC